MRSDLRMWVVQRRGNIISLDRLRRRKCAMRYSRHSHSSVFLPKSLAAMDRFKNQFVCVWVSKSVSLSVCYKKELNARNLLPIFAKLAIMVVSQEMWSSIAFGGNPEYFWPSNRKRNYFLPLLLWKNMLLTSNISKMVRYTMFDSKEVR